MFTDIFIYIRFAVIAAADFALFSKTLVVEDEPEFWAKRTTREADLVKAAMREDLGYGAS